MTSRLVGQYREFRSRFSKFRTKLNNSELHINTDQFYGASGVCLSPKTLSLSMVKFDRRDLCDNWNFLTFFVCVLGKFIADSSIWSHSHPRE